MRITVIGATGYLGSSVAKQLADAGHGVHAWGHRRRVEREGWGESFLSTSYGDISGDEMRAAVIEQAPDAIIYTVSLDHHQSELSLSDAIECNVSPVAGLLEVLPGELPACRFIYFSTAQVYGSLLGRITEDSRTTPTNNYGLTHLMVDELIGKYVNDGTLNAACLRISNGYGEPEFQDANCWWLVINDLCKSAVENSEIRLQSDGTPERDFVHLRDINNAVECVLSRASNTNEHIFNVGGGATYTILELAKLVVKVHESRYGNPLPIFLPGGEKVPPGQPGVATKHFHYDISRIGNLGYAPQVSVEAGISEMFDYLDNRVNEK